MPDFYWWGGCFDYSASELGLNSRFYTAIDPAAPVFAASSLRDVKSVRVISAIPSRSSAAIIQRNQPFPNIVFIFFHGLDRI
jgi:hypothetical protein